MPSVSSQPFFFVFGGEQKRLLLHKRSENVCTFLANYNRAWRDSSDTWSLEICWNTFFFCPTAVLLAASASGDVGESLHFWTHYQQKDGAGHHRGYR